MSAATWDGGSVRPILRRWTEEGDLNYTKVFDLLTFIGGQAYFQYIPTVGPEPAFDERLVQWIANVEDEESRKTLLKLALQILFVSREQMYALYRAALTGAFYRAALDDTCDLSDGGDVALRLSRAADCSWFCPITDSMDIANFYHANRLEGVSDRPAWMTLDSFGSEGRIREYLQAKEIERIVLLEDFVGSGSQMESPVKFAAGIDSEIEVLVLPLICCPTGVRKGMELANSLPNVHFEPVLELHEELFLDCIGQAAESEFFSELRRVVVRTYPLVAGPGLEHGHPGSPYGPFGYKSTGGTVVLHSNTPDNTLPAIHHASESWKPLFPRSSRV